MLTFAIETSCDDTGVAIIKSDSCLKHEIIVNLVSSQFKVHRKFGGVVPKLASREHSKNLPLLVKKLFVEIKKILPDFSFNDIDIVAYTALPGLEPCLLIGITVAKALAYFLNKPSIAVNHIHSHIYSVLLSPEIQKNINLLKFPAQALVVSGGHTELYYLKNLYSLKKIGQTEDDASGEAFDKGARLLGGPYPGGPFIEKLSYQGDKKAFSFPRPMMKKGGYNFSFSGLKTALLYKLQNMKKHEIKKRAADLAASYQEAIIESLIIKTLKAASDFNIKTLIVSGGVSANSCLIDAFKKKIAEKFNNISLLVPPKNLSTDNAAMIGVLGAIQYLKNKKI